MFEFDKNLSYMFICSEGEQRSKAAVLACNQLHIKANFVEGGAQKLQWKPRDDMSDLFNGWNQIIAIVAEPEAQNYLSQLKTIETAFKLLNLSLNLVSERELVEAFKKIGGGSMYVGLLGDIFKRRFS